ncbi:hypothetical protein [Caenimonas aquaedulcis]|uniref:Uncharacterized protein n=1 Tax=Caenimonas aquaedulcis TaxID=2793270 RepID=A0A931MGS8_9BURK|nr:hypothetical protein [Caenimonas aquaedulcis]MBG9388278.1 hypothetical protein [Caenimonas aquaedulcis]
MHLLRGIVVHGFGLACALAMASLPARAGSVRVSGDTITFDGRIDRTSAAQFLQLLQDPQVTRLVITSRGGLVDPALDMAEAIHERQLDVEVPADCLSSCANYIFPAARRKRLGWPGAVAWHGNMTHVLYLQQTGQAAWSDERMADARRLARREAAFFQRIGVDGFICWFGKIAPYDAEAFYYLSPSDMEKFGVRDVTLETAQAPEPGPEGLRQVAVEGDARGIPRPFVRLDD